MNCRAAFFLALLVVSSLFAAAEGTRTWEQSRFDDFSKGTAHGVALRSTGGLELAPAWKDLAATPSTYIWSLAADENGAVFAAAGSPARVYRVTADGKASVIFEARELQVQSIAAAKGVLYAATAPDGKVYKIERKPGAAAPVSSAGANSVSTDPAWTSSVFFDPATKYIWGLALDAGGNLFVATGDHGEIFRVTPQGNHSRLFQSDEAHIRSLVVDGNGNLIAGSDGSGLIYRISPQGEAFVLFSTARKEITALALDGDGNIYAAAVGDKRPSPPATPGQTPTFTPITPGVTSAPQPIASGNPGFPQTPFTGPFPFPAFGVSTGSDIYRIATDGAPLKVWTSRDELIYTLAFDGGGRLLAGTGNRGRLLAITGASRGEDDYSELLRAPASQITALVRGRNGSLFAATSNLGKLFLLGPAPENEGSFDSDVFDARLFSHWGRLEFRGAGNVDVLVRSGSVDNPDRNWSSWQRVDLAHGAPIPAPPARFLQWRAVLHAGPTAPRVESVAVNYLLRNVAPQIDEVNVALGVRYQSSPRPVGPEVTLSTTGSNPQQPRYEPPVPTVRDPDALSVKWSAHDDNDDQLVYSLYYRGDGESRWLLLKDNLTDRFYSLDASLLPDGGYTMKVVASDTPSHPPGQDLGNEKESSHFEIDSTPPVIAGLSGTLESGRLRVRFSATDSFSPIKRAEASLDAGDWQFVEPTGQLSDARTESYDFQLPLAEMPATATASTRTAKKTPAAEGPIEHVIVVRVYDRYDNLASAKTVLRAR